MTVYGVHLVLDCSYTLSSRTHAESRDILGLALSTRASHADGSSKAPLRPTSPFCVHIRDGTMHGTDVNARNRRLLVGAGNAPTAAAARTSNECARVESAYARAITVEKFVFSLTGRLRIPNEAVTFILL